LGPDGAFAVALLFFVASPALAAGDVTAFCSRLISPGRRSEPSVSIHVG
jgi:hypothetical protein